MLHYLLQEKKMHRQPRKRGMVGDGKERRN
jgi:hypothetical protein